VTNVNSQGPYLTFSPKLHSRGQNCQSLKFRDQFCKFPKLLRFFTKGPNMTTYDLKRTFGDFSFKICAQGLFLPIFESWGTELPIWLTLYVFHLFLLILHLKHIKHNFEIFLVFWCISECFCMFLQLRLIKNDECLSTHNGDTKARRA
jgi:hypothetical protein